jgi:hypothetical protein
MRGKAKPSVMKLTPLALLLCASCMQTYADVQSTQRKCSTYVEPFLEQTKHAPAPQSAASNEWVNFGIGQSGKVNDANTDKDKGKRVLRKCEEENQRALEAAAERAKPWYKRIF